jgi:hypothetical protein
MDRASQIVMNDQVITVDYALTVRTDQFGSLQYGDNVQHEGLTYKLQHEPLRLADGRFCVMVLEMVEVVGTLLTTLSGLRLRTLDNRVLRIL